MSMRVLGIETSCDETGVAIFDSREGLLAHRVHSQAGLHRDFGGVVPELASRDHVRRVLPLISATLEASNTKLSSLSGIAYTSGPGLIGALLVGVSVGRALSYALGVPGIGVHHMEAHLLAPLLEADSPPFPFLALLVSGAHTQLVRVERIGSYELLGESLDDAAGEAIDKTAKLLGLGYPGGPALSALAMKGRRGRFEFPRPMTDRPGLDFSFSGLKTFTLNTLHASDGQPQTHADIARAFLDSIIDTLIIKCRRAVEETGLMRLVAAGGVSANTELRSGLERAMRERGGRIWFPRPEFCTDNGAMIALAGCLKLGAGRDDPLAFGARPRWAIDSGL